VAAKKLILANFLPYRLSVTSNRVSRMIASQYQTLFDLTIAEWRTIAVVAESGPVSQQAVCQRTYMDKVTVSRAAITLFDRKILHRMPNPQDKRSHLLDLTAAGHELYAAVAPRALEMETQIFSALSSQDRDELTRLLAGIDAVIDGLQLS
jgi:DNA-binding MarR family transcriptional regulator